MGRTGWAAPANGHVSFLLQNLPLGVFSPRGEATRGGVAIGEKILDISAALERGLFSGAAPEAAQTASGRTLNKLLEAGPERGYASIGFGECRGTVTEAPPLA